MHNGIYFFIIRIWCTIVHHSSAMHVRDTVQSGGRTIEHKRKNASDLIAT